MKFRLGGWCYKSDKKGKELGLRKRDPELV
jgi:hypothetical protein